MTDVFEALFELLFKYRPLVFRQGDFVLASPWSFILIGLVIVVGTAVTLTTYARARGKSTPVDRGVLSALRLTALATVVFCLFRPVLVLSSIVPQQNFLGILIDNSRSMEIADRDNEPRHTFVNRSFESETSGLRAALAEAIGNLPERLQLVIKLHFIEELNLTEIAAVLDVSVPRVHQLKSSALAKLKLAIVESENA